MGAKIKVNHSDKETKYNRIKQEKEFRPEHQNIKQKIENKA